jgi:hypothetical protein
MRPALCSPWSVLVPARIVPSVGGAADLQRLAVEVIAPERQHLPQPHPCVGEAADHCLVAPSRLGEVVHLLEAEDADRTAALPCPRVVGADADSLERVEVGDFVGDRVLGHRRERAQDSDDAGGRPALNPQHVVDQGEGMAAAKLAQRPSLQRDALDLNLEDAADPVLVGRVGSLRARMAGRPGGEVLAQGVRTVREPYASSIACCASRLSVKVPLPLFQVGLAMWRLPSRPV